MQTLQVLIATMHQTDYSLLEKMNIQSDAVVINQCDNESEVNFQYKSHNVLWVNTLERGLSKSRNMALRKATADYCIIADDDMEYCDGYADKVIKAFETELYADLIRFQVEGIERKYKTYPSEKQKIGFISSMKTSSVEVAFRRKSIIDKNIKFNELIGAGTEFKMGEENAFIFDCLRKNLKYIYVPICISKLHLGNSSWFSGFNEEYFVGRGAAFTAMSRTFSVVLIIQWAIRKYSLYKDSCTVFNAIKTMFKGRKLYITKIKRLKNDT